MGFFLTYVLRNLAKPHFMGMLLRVHFVQPLCFIVEESEAFERVNFVSHRQIEAELDLEACSPDSLLCFFFLLTL